MRGLRRRVRRVAGGGGYAFAAMLAIQPAPAEAFDFSSLDIFGLFGSKDKPPAVSSATLPYQLEFDVSGTDDARAWSSRRPRRTRSTR